MAKKVTGYVKLQIPAGKATPAPPVGPALGQAGVNIMDFCKTFNARTQAQDGLIIPVVITVYSEKIGLVRKTQNELAELGKKGIVFGGAEYGQRTEYLFTKLNDLKPAMIEEATRKAREVAEKFAADSNSTLGKIKSANQGQFTVNDRDSNTPHIKNVRVVSTVEYYLSD